jgi:IS30 family transposase
MKEITVIRRRFQKAELTTTQKIKIHEMFNDGYGANTIALRIGSISSAVASYMRENGLQRDRVEAMRAHNAAKRKGK